MSSTRTERERLKTVYSVGGKPSKKWATKVDKMSDAQVIAIFRRLQAQKKL